MAKSWRLYRAYGRRGRLLYLGQTTRPDLRIRQHEADKAWAREVSRWRVERRRYRSESAVLRAEAAAIRVERPLFNIEHNEENPGRVNPHTMRYAAGPRRGEPYRPVFYADVHGGGWRPWNGRRRGGLARSRWSYFWGWVFVWLGSAVLISQVVVPAWTAFVGAALGIVLSRLAARKLFNFDI
jgi:hypothetical protein